LTTGILRAGGGEFFTFKTGIPGGPGLGSGHIVLDGDPLGTQPLLTFRPMSIVAKRSPISQQLLSSCCYWVPHLC